MGTPPKQFNLSICVKSDVNFTLADGVEIAPLDNGYVRLSKVVSQTVADQVIALDTKRPRDTAAEIFKLLIERTQMPATWTLMNPSLTFHKEQQ